MRVSHVLVVGSTLAIVLGACTSEVRRSDIDALHARLNEVEARLALATTPNTTTTPDVIVVNMVSKTTGGTTARNARGQAIGFLTPMCIVISVGTAIQEVCREHYGQIAGFEAEQNKIGRASCRERV